jgi:hypothetical protein
MVENLIIENNILIKADAEIGEIIVPDNIIEIKSEAFLNCSKLQSVSIPETVKCIGKGAFKGCTALKYIQIPFVGKSISRVNNTHFGYIFGADSYQDNSKFVPVSLAEVKVLGGESIGKNAFYGCL